MSSPIAIPRVTASSEAGIEHSTSSSASSSTGLYVPVHKRGASTSRPASPSTPPTSPPRRSHSPAKSASSPAQRKRNSKGHKASKSQDATSTTHIPKQSMIPKHSNIPFVYTFTDLLELSYQAATLKSEQVERLTNLISFMPSMESSPAPAPAEKQAIRRRREGRRGKTPQQKVAAQTADVTTRRARHGHGTWGWHPFTAAESQQHDLEASWRHGPAVGIAAA